MQQSIATTALFTVSGARVDSLPMSLINPPAFASSFQVEKCKFSVIKEILQQKDLNFIKKCKCRSYISWRELKVIRL